MSKKTSLVGFFDILGYQSFLRSNSAIDAAEEIFDIIQKAPSEATKKWREKQPTGDSDWINTLDGIKSVVFSDTIVVSLEIDQKTAKELNYALFCKVCMKIMENMFERGLPLRGAVTYGQFQFKKTCIAGQAIVDGHNLAATLETCGCAISPELSSFIDRQWTKNKDFWEIEFPYYLFPLKSSTELKTRAVMWQPKSGHDHLYSVRKSFWMWNKDVSRSVDVKIEQTVKMLDFFQHHREENRKRKAKVIRDIKRAKSLKKEINKFQSKPHD